MDHQAEVIRQQMEETRTALTDKLETLELRMVDTVQGTTAAVNDTVVNVKDAVEETIGTVKESVQETVDSVKETFNVRRQVEQHPWAMLGGSIAVGYVAGCMLTPRLSANGHAAPESADDHIAKARLNYRAAAERNEVASAAPAQSEPTQPTSPELKRLKGIALGAAFSLLRDLVVETLPESLEPSLREVIDDLTVKFGGEPIKGPLIHRNVDGSHHQGIV